MTRRWLFADQLGPHFLDAPDQPVLLIESTAVFGRRRFHRQKAHLVLHALRTRARELGDQAIFLQAHTYGDALAQVGGDIDVVQPTTCAADRFVRDRGIEVLPERGFATTRAEFAGFAQDRRRLLLEDFYRWQRARFGLLMDGSEPAGGRWNYDHDNREPPPKAAHLDLDEPWLAAEDDLDGEVRDDLDRLASATARSSSSARTGPRWFAVDPRRRRCAPCDTFVPTGWRSSARRGRHAGRRPVDGALAAVRPRSTSGCCTRWSASRRPRTPTAPAMHRWPPSRATSARSSAGGSTSGSIYWHVGDDYRRRNALEAHQPLPQLVRATSTHDAGRPPTA